MLHLEEQLHIDEKKYVDLLDTRYSFGYGDGQRSAMRLIQQMFCKEGLTAEKLNKNSTHGIQRIKYVSSAHART